MSDLGRLLDELDQAAANAWESIDDAITLLNAYPQMAAALRAVEALAEELDREAESYVAAVEQLPTPTERTSAAARAITSGGAADRLRAALAAGQGDGQ